MSGGRAKKTLLVDALEALIAAIYLDGGMEPAREFVKRFVVAPGALRGRARRTSNFRRTLPTTRAHWGWHAPTRIVALVTGPP